MPRRWWLGCNRRWLLPWLNSDLTSAGYIPLWMWKKGWSCYAATSQTQAWKRNPVLKTEIISVTASGDIVSVRHAVRRQAVAINLSLVDQTKIVTAASELARNMLIYGGGGQVTLE